MGSDAVDRAPTSETQDDACLDPNSMQVGGTHYKTSYEHWDWVCKTYQHYLVGNATKYVARWRLKDGVKDLKKALHYVNKLEVVWDDYCAAPKSDSIRTETKLFCEANKLFLVEETIMHVLASCTNTAAVRRARELILQLMEDANAVPLEDSNKHAERVDGDKWLRDTL